MTKAIIYDIFEGDINSPIATIEFKDNELPNSNDNLIINYTRYVVCRREYIIDCDMYEVALQVKKYIPNNGGY